MAACLEEAGLHPLLVFIEGHAMVGVWLDDQTSATPTVDDVGAQRDPRESVREV